MRRLEIIGLALTLACALVGCGAHHAARAKAPPPMAAALDVTPLARQVIGAHACRKLRGMFLRAPLAPGTSGTAYVATCASSPAAAALHLDVGGFVWDAGALDVAHVRFERPVTMSFLASVDLDARAYYHPPTKLLTVHAKLQATIEEGASLVVSPGSFPSWSPRGPSPPG